MKSKLFDLFKCLIILAWLSAPAHASNITGTVKTANGSAVRNGTLGFTLNQAGIVAGSFSVTSTPVYCYTSTDGSVVGLPNPIVAPTAVGNTASGSIILGTYLVRISYVTTGPTTETIYSPSTSVVLGATGRIDVTGPTVQPTNAYGYRVYAGTVSGSEHLQSTVVGFGNTSITTYNSGGAASSTTNTTVCAVQFNDTIIPSFTKYSVSLTNSNGASVPGFPQNWYLAGSSVDISTSYPLAAVSQQTRFPTPILANPSSNAQQSVASPLTLNGYSLTAGALRLPNNSSPPACQAGEATLYQQAGVLVICQNGSPLATGSFFGWYDAATQSLIGGQLLISSRAIQNPATSAYLQLYYDSGTDAGYIKAHNYTSAVSKPVHIVGAFVSDSTISVTGAATFASTLAVTGAATLSSTLAVTGNVTVNTNKFSVTAASGNTSIAGTLALGTAGSVVGTITLSNATSGSIVLTPIAGALGSKTITFPAATMTVSGVASYECGTSAACSPTNVSTSDWHLFGSSALVSASPSTASISGLSPAFTSTATYWCTATPQGTTAAIAAAGAAINKTSGSAFTITGPNTVTTVIDWHCWGH